MNVYAPRALEELKNGLKCVNPVTVSCENSNHTHAKQPAISIINFQAYNLETPVKKHLTFWKSQGKLQI
jgi:hypothetical protein